MRQAWLIARTHPLDRRQLGATGTPRHRGLAGSHGPAFGRRREAPRANRRVFVFFVTFVLAVCDSIPP